MLLDGRPTSLHVREAEGFIARAVGLLRARCAAGAEVLRIPRCAAIHTFGMRRAIDVAFVGRDDRVLRLVGSLGPWRFAWCRRACAVWELPAGELHRLGVATGTRLSVAPPPPGDAAFAAGALCDPAADRASARGPTPRCATQAGRRARSMRGAAMVEFLVVGMFVLLPLTFATLELAQLTVARHALDYATFEAARSGAVNGADRTTMRRALARGLIPLFAPADSLATLRAGAGGGGAGGAGAGPGSESEAVAALARASAEVLRPDLTRLDIENPSAAAARDFAVIEAGERVIPNDGLDQRNPRGTQSGQSLREANVLAIRVRYCRRLVMPIIDRVVPALLRLSLLDPLDQLCLAQRRVPIEARAVVHMQSPLRVAQLEGG